MGRVKIQSGQYLNRSIHFLEGHNIRPSGARVRKTLFDWIRFDLKNKRCLDLFSGSGVLAFESMSQGANSVLCIDYDSDCLLYTSDAADEP